MHVVVVDEWLPYPVDCGKKLRSFHLLSPLAKKHRVTYVAPRSGNPQNDATAARAMEDEGFEIEWVDQPVPSNGGPLFAPRLAANLISPYPYSVQRHINKAMQATVRRLATAGDVDLWHVEWTPYAQNLPTEINAPWVINAHNVESLIWQRYRDLERNRLKSWYIDQQYKKFFTFEKKVFSASNCVIVCTKRDAEIAQEQFDAKDVKVVHNGVALDRFPESSAQRDPRELLFLGSLSWRPNLDAVTLLLDDLFPAMVARDPSLHLSIVGFAPPAWLSTRVAKMPQVELHANAPRVEPFLEKCGALIVPLRVGGGSRIKILEALAAGCPVIATEIGAEGLHLQPGKDYVLARTAEEFASTTVSALADYENLLQTAKSGRQVVQELYDWSQLATQLGEIWESQCCRQEVASTGCSSG